MAGRLAVRVSALVLAAALLPAGIAGAQQEPRGIENFCPPGEVPPSGFTYTAGNPHAEAIECVAFYGIAFGTTETTYSPRMQVRRDQMASFIARLLDQFAEAYGVMLPADPPHAFDDVAEDNPHALRINQLADVGIVGGFPDGTYRPGATVTRDGMATFINGAVEFLTGEALAGPPGQFTDTAGNPHEDNINGLAAFGIVAGFGDGTYRPRDPVFRDQMASFIARAGDFVTMDAFTSFFVVIMVGEAELDDSVPDEPRFGQGEPDAFGIVVMGMDSENGTVCYEGFVDAEGPFVGNHIHEGRMDENGPIVVELEDPTEDGEIPLVCHDADAEILVAIEEDPSSYYVNVHTEEFPAGAVRGQLEGEVMFSRLLWAFEVDEDGNFGQGEEEADGIGLTLIDLAHQEICVYAQTDATPPFVGFHIHVAPMGENGPIVVNLNDPDPVNRESSTCLDADDLEDEELENLDDLVFDRDNYYLNIHTAQHPAGAVRGQIDTFGIIVDLSADEVVDGGEEGATGTFYGQAGFMTGRVCHWVVTDGVTPPFTAMHTHRGPAGEDGPPIIEHEPPDDDTGEVSECYDIDQDLLFDVIVDLDGHYLQVHTEDHPDGVIPELAGARRSRGYAAADAGARRGLDRLHQPR
jgi:hypothetical protein